MPRTRLSKKGRDIAKFLHVKRRITKIQYLRKEQVGAEHRGKTTFVGNIKGRSRSYDNKKSFSVSLSKSIKPNSQLETKTLIHELLHVRNPKLSHKKLESEVNRYYESYLDKKQKARHKTRYTVEEEIDYDDIRDTMLDNFGSFKRSEHSRKHYQITNALERELFNQDVADEGDGWYQLNFNGTSGDRPESKSIKLRFNPRQKKMQIYMSGRRYL